MVAAGTQRNVFFVVVVVVVTGNKIAYSAPTTPLLKAMNPIHDTLDHLCCQIFSCYAIMLTIVCYEYIKRSESGQTTIDVESNKLKDPILSPANYTL